MGVSAAAGPTLLQKAGALAAFGNLHREKNMEQKAKATRMTNIREGELDILQLHMPFQGEGDPRISNPKFKDLFPINFWTIASPVSNVDPFSFKLEEEQDQTEYAEKFLELNQRFIEERFMSREALLETIGNINTDVCLSYGFSRGIAKLGAKLEKGKVAKQPSIHEVANEDQSAKRVGLALKEFNDHPFVKRELSKHPLGARDSKDRENVDAYIEVLESILGKGMTYNHLSTIEVQRVVQRTVMNSLKSRLQKEIANDPNMDLNAMLLFLRTQLRSTLKIEKNIKTLSHIQVGHLKGNKTTQSPEINEFMTHFNESIEEIEKHLPKGTTIPPVMIITWLHEACRPLDQLFGKLSSLQWKETVVNDHGIQVATEATVEAYKAAIIEKAKEISPNGDGVLQLTQKPKLYKELYALHHGPQGGQRSESESKWQQRTPKRKASDDRQSGSASKGAKAARKSSTCSKCSGWNHSASDCRIPNPTPEMKERIVSKFQKWNKANGYHTGKTLHVTMKGKKKEKESEAKSESNKAEEDSDSDH
jgi:hypothetical protein